MDKAGQQQAGARKTAGTVLVADDTPVMRKACTRSLEKAGHNVIIAEDGNRAMDAMRSEDIDVALLDIKMPGVSGIEVLKAIKAEKPLVEVIMMTAYATQDIAEEASNFGSSGFLTKPFDDVKILTDAVGKAVTKKKLREAAGSGSRPDLEELLLVEGLVTEAQLQEARNDARAWNTTPPKALVARGVISGQDLDWALAKALDMSFVNLRIEDMDADAARMAPGWLARKHRLIPFLREGRSLHVAVEDPFDKEGIESLEKATGYKVIPAKGAAEEIDEMIKVFFTGESRSLAELIETARTAQSAQRPGIIREILEMARIKSVDEIEIEEVEGGWRLHISGVIEDV